MQTTQNTKRIFRIKLRASLAGSISVKYTETRFYTVEGETADDAQDAARRLACAEGLEHTLITKCVEASL